MEATNVTQKSLGVGREIILFSSLEKGFQAYFDLLTHKTQNTIMENFKGISPHRPLSKDGKEIRIIKLLPAPFSAPIECVLEHIILQPKADYEAVSYSWGTSPMRRCILLDGKPYEITPNLFDGLKYLRREASARKLWVDSLCINQTDTEERNREVLKMRNIYKLARGVLIWLGDYYPYSRLHVKRIFEYVTSLAACKSQTHDEALIRSTGFDELWHLQNQLQKFIESREWFQRMWVLQEVSVRPKLYKISIGLAPRLICGDLSLPFLYLRLVQEHWVDPFKKQRIGLPPICRSLYPMDLIWAGHQDIITETYEDFPLAERLAWILASVSANFHCSDQRDIVYAILGLLNADELPQQLIPEYSKRPNDVLIDCASYIVTQSRILTILLFNSMQTEGLPSWVPDWQHESVFPIVYAPKAHARTHVRVLNDSNALEVSIIELTEVQLVGQPLQDSVLSTWSDFFLDAEEHLGVPVRGYSSFGKALWQMLVAFDFLRQEVNNPGWHLGATEKVPPFFFREHTHVTSLHDLRSGFLQHILGSMATTIANRYIFRAGDGSLGIMCQAGVVPNKGDRIGTIKGAYSDCVLRECMDGYKIIGWCERTSRSDGTTLGDVGFLDWTNTRIWKHIYDEFWNVHEGKLCFIY